VHGGDAPDKGNEVGGSIRVIRTLLRLKGKYPDRVELLLGNRDVNKIRFTSELADSQFEPGRLASIPGPFWVPPTKRATPLSYIAAKCGVPESELTKSQRQQHNTLANRIRYLLKETMGSQGEFERRQRELTQLNGGREATEEETCASFVESVKPGGFMYRYISEGKLAALIDDTLYVHGGVICSDYRNDAVDCVGYIPGRNERIERMDEWVAALNAWKDEQVRDWTACPEWEDPDKNNGFFAESGHKRGGYRLLDGEYIGPNCEPSVVMGR
jgi:hypothetical protein